MITQDNKKTQDFPLTYDLKSHAMRSWSFKTVLVSIILAVIFGSAGSIAATIYAFRLPAFQKYVHPNDPVAQEQPQVKQNIILNEESSTTEVVKKASPAVVSIVVSKDLSKIPGYGRNPFEGEFFFPFYQQPQQQTPKEPNIQQIGAGTGFFITGDGLILTNKHVVADEQASYTVITSDGTSLDAKVLARDPVNDLAIVKVETKNASKLELADSTSLQIGQRVIAIGNSLGQYQNTVTTGVISGIGRSITAGAGGSSEQLEGVIQTDTAINPGNSGGPLLNVLGEVIGINTAIDRQGQLVGFAIPANDAAKAVASFQKNGSITRPVLGIRYVLITPSLAKQENLPQSYGALIIRGQDAAEVPGSPAEKAGLKENDIILQVNDIKIDSKNSLTKVLKNYNAGDIIFLTVFREDKEQKLSVTLGEAK